MSYTEMSSVLPENSIVDLNLLRPPQISTNVSQDSSVTVVQQTSSPRVWFEWVLIRRPMTQQELADHSELFEALDAENRTNWFIIVFIIFMVLFFILVLMLLITGVIPFCNLK